MEENREHQQADYAGKIANLCDADKPREKALRHGIQSLSDTELLALIIGSGQPGKSVIDLSREMLNDCGNDLTVLARLTIPEMMKRFKGIGPAKAVGISASLQLASRLRSQAGLQQRITSSRDAYNAIPAHLQHEPTEEFWILMLSRSNSILRTECISKGGTAATYVEPKLVVKKSLDYLASGIILVHNHPSGNLTPSLEDENLTGKIKAAASLLDIKVLDHLIVTSSGYYSFNDEGKL